MNQKTKQILEWSFVLLVISVFLGFKLTNLTFHFGDGNAYFYMAQAVTQGELPYQDFFLADPPFLVFFLAGLRLFFGDHLLFYQALPIILELATALILFLLLKKQNNPWAFLAPLVYLFSFSVLALSDYLTGVQLVVFLFVLALFFFERGHPFLSGLFWGLSALTKLYILPAFVGFALFVFLEKDRRILVRLIGGLVFCLFLVLGPLALLSFPRVVDDLLIHHLNRPAGLNKPEVFAFLFKREWLLIGLALAGALVSRQKKFLLPFCLTVVFLLFFPDLYYTYFGSLLPYLVILSLSFVAWLWAKSLAGQDWSIFILVLYILFLGVSFWYYQQSFFVHGRFLNATEIAAYLKTRPEPFPLYGSHEVAPLVALLSQKKLLNGYIDTNAQVFASGALDLEAVSRAAVQNGVFLLARITDRPEEGITDFGYEGFFSPRAFRESCQRLKEFPSTAQELDNHLVIYRCSR
ncbi:MAG: hypothetical protein HY577_01640 [Candidatus Nealsonbacteria bacterium]|nr:hypothetical protein [Candidatus Nealsonbacteria bacterium]